MLRDKRRWALATAATAVAVTGLLASAALPALAADSAEVDGKSPAPSPPRATATLGTREMILVNQVGFARGTARWRARELYRLMQNPVEAAEVAAGDRARAVSGGVAALRRELHEQRVLTDELGHVRSDQAALNRPAAPSPLAASPAGGAARDERYLAPVAGGVEVPFGPARDPATGLWMFRAGVRLRSRPGEVVRAPAAGVVRRVVETPLHGRAVVLSRADGLVSIIEGVGEVAVVAGQSLRRGETVAIMPPPARGPTPVSSVFLEIWRGPAPVDPTTLLGAR